MFLYPIKSHRFYNKDLPKFDHISYFEEIINDERVLLIFKIIIEKNGINFFNNKEYCERLSKELSFFLNFQTKNELDTILVLEEIAFFHENKNIAFNIGRAKSGCCFLFYTLGITKINSIYYNLKFETFIGSKNGSIFYDLDCPDKGAVDFLKLKYSNFLKSVRYRLEYSFVSAVRKVLREADPDFFKSVEYKIRECESLKAEKFPFKRFTKKESLEFLIQESSPIRNYLLKNPGTYEELIDLFNHEGRKAMPRNFSFADQSNDKEVDFDNVKSIFSLVDSSGQTISSNKVPEDGEVNDLIGSFFNSQGIKNVLENRMYKLIFAKRKNHISRIPQNINSIVNLSHLSVILSRSYLFYTLLDGYNFQKFEEKISSFTNETFGYILYQDQVSEILSKFFKISYEETFDLRWEMRDLISEKTSFLEIKEKFKNINFCDEDFFIFLAFNNHFAVSRSHFIGEAIKKYCLSN